MNATTTREYARSHTWKDTIGCTAVLLAILLGTIVRVYSALNDPTLAAITVSTSA
jgi:uncharacterized membrane protein YadS